MSSIKHLSKQLQSEFGLTPIMAAEIECYVLLKDESAEAMDKFWVPVEKAFRGEGLSILRIEKERGLHQYEIVTHVMAPEQLAATLLAIRRTIEKYAARNNVACNFAGKPFSGQPSSGMHLHLHLSDAEGINSYHKTDEWTSDTLRWSLGGLLATLAADMAIFFPSPADDARLDDKDHVPKIFGWGVNNRYCALRIPANPDPYDKRIEHRVPCANADPEAAIAAMLNGVIYGLREAIEPPAQQYGKVGEVSMQKLAETAFRQ